MNNKMNAPIINMEEVEDFILKRIHQEFPDFAVSKLLVEMVLEFENEFLEKEGIALRTEYVYLYDNGDLFGEENEMIGYDYELASIHDLIEQKWCDERDSGKVFVVAEGQYLYEGGRFKEL
ncbi:hypothetical protein [Bacillus sp. PS06]|uniref:hypothetical protein n=1 Tax=Bacillus sp. PS06 TaxID=2764176 RepID=UPI001786DD72|nr:hypothetical protein [Bacillus sp. PS06]MBD8069774.1 hypothetical protein [Bacillus sp. PS06]